MSSTTKPYFNQDVQEIVDHLNGQHAGELQIVNHGRTVSVELLAVDAEMLLSSLEPIRPQLVAELQRMATFCNYLAMTVADDDWLDQEASADETHATVSDLFNTILTTETRRKVSAA